VDNGNDIDIVDNDNGNDNGIVNIPGVATSCSPLGATTILSSYCHSESLL
jgi:hypothetical protein